MMIYEISIFLVVIRFDCLNGSFFKILENDSPEIVKNRITRIQNSKKKNLNFNKSIPLETHKQQKCFQNK